MPEPQTTRSSAPPVSPPPGKSPANGGRQDGALVGNKKIAADIRAVAASANGQKIFEALQQQKTTTAVLEAMLFTVADIIDIYDEGGLDIEDWDAANALCQLIAGGKLFRPSGMPPIVPKPTLFVARATDQAASRMRRQ